MRRALLLAAVYYGLYQLMGLLVGAVFGASGDVRGEPGSAVDVLIGTAMPIVLASMLLLAFALSLGWLKELFGRQPVPRRGWMWLAVGVVLLINVSAFLSIDYAEAGGALMAAWLFTGLFVGFAKRIADPRFCRQPHAKSRTR